MIGSYFDTRPCDISILGYMLSGLLYPRVCGFGYLKNKPAPTNPTGMKFIPLRNPRVSNLVYARTLMEQKPIGFRVSDTRCHPYCLASDLPLPLTCPLPPGHLASRCCDGVVAWCLAVVAATEDKFYPEPID